MEILILFALFIISVILLLITVIKHFLLRKKYRKITENVKKLDFVKRINKYVKILLIIYLVFFIGIYAFIVVDEYIFRFNDVNDSNTISISALKAAFEVYTDNNSYIYNSFFTIVQLFILIYVPTRVIANIILIKKLSKNNTLNENEKSIFKKYLINKIIFNLCIGIIIFFIIVMLNIILSWSCC